MSGIHREWDDDSDGEGNRLSDERTAEKEKAARKNFITEELAKRRGSSSASKNQFEPPDEDCPLIDATNQKIPNITVKVSSPTHYKGQCPCSYSV